MCKFENVMFAKTILKFSIIFISLFMTISFFFIGKNIVIENDSSYSYESQDVPIEIRRIEVLPYTKTIGKASLTQPVFKTNVKIEN